MKGSGDTKEDRVHASTDMQSSLIALLLPHELNESLTVSVASAGHEPLTVKVCRESYLKHPAEMTSV